MRIAWKHYLVRGIGILALVVVAAGLVFAFLRTGDEAITQAESEERRISVALTSAEEREFIERLTVQGNVAAKNFVMVPAKAGGPLETLFVDEGDPVVEGETKLFQVDSIKFEKALEIAQQDMEVARYARRESEANLRQVRAEQRKAELDYERFKRLYEERAVPLDAYEQQQTRYEQSLAMVEHAESLVDLATEQEKKAKTAAAIAEEDLRDTLVYAPISGTISHRILERGEMAEMGRPVFRIDDGSTVEIAARLPAKYYNRIRTDETVLQLRVNGEEAGEHIITYKSPTIDPALRTFEIKCVIANPPEHVVPGAMANMGILIQRRPGLGVPLDAVQTRAGESIVFTVEDDIARAIEVETDLETDEWVEIISDEIEEGTPIVSMGQFQLDDGMPVAVQEDAA